MSKKFIYFDQPILRAIALCNKERSFWHHLFSAAGIEQYQKVTLLREEEKGLPFDEWFMDCDGSGRFCCEIRVPGNEIVEYKTMFFGADRLQQRIYKIVTKDNIFNPNKPILCKGKRVSADSIDISVFEVFLNKVHQLLRSTK